MTIKDGSDQNNEKQDCLYDIGLVCATNYNIGNNLTNYALYQYFNDLGYKVMLVSYPVEVSSGEFSLFQQQPYPESDVSDFGNDKWQFSKINIMCDKFVLGSDQLLRDMFLKSTDLFTCLDWVESRKYKITYAASFGVDYFEGDVGTQKKTGYLLRRFQKISVREQSGVELLKELFGINAEWVLDPVFICDKKHYERMSAQGKKRLPDEKYVGSYLLDIDDKKERAVLSAADDMTDGEYITITQPGTLPHHQANLDCKLKVITDTTIEEWLAMIANCDYFITDSFHGMCFALIFQKQFCVVFDKESWRGISRIKSLLDVLQLDTRLVEDINAEKILDLFHEPIDYHRVNAILSAERERSKKWLKDSLSEKQDCFDQYDIYDYFWELNAGQQKEIQALQKQVDLMKRKIQNELFILTHTFQNINIESLRKEDKDMQIVAWGAGDCFKRNIKHIKSFCEMKYVCDSDPQKWGKELDEQVVCISPKMLSEMNNIMVIIMVDNVAVSFQIVKELLEMGITNFDHVENWLSYVEI